MAHRTPKWPHCASDGITYSSSPSLLCSRHPIVLALPQACEASSSPMASPHTAWSALTVPPWDHLLTPSASSGLCSITSITVGLFLATGFQITTATPSQTPFPRFLIFRSRIITAWHPICFMCLPSAPPHIPRPTKMQAPWGQGFFFLFHSFRIPNAYPSAWILGGTQ